MISFTLFGASDTVQVQALLHYLDLGHIFELTVNTAEACFCVWVTLPLTYNSSMVTFALLQCGLQSTLQN